MEEIVYLNGSLVPRSQARISVYDQGFLYGFALFETMRAYHGRIFLLERHMKRLRESDETIGLGSQLANAGLAEACVETLKANRLQDARLRLTVSRGEVDAFPGIGANIVPTILVTAKSYSPLPQEVYEAGFKAVVSSLCRCSQSPLSRLKSANYLTSILAKMELERVGLDEALLLNENGYLTEGSISNVFFVVSNSLVTPSLESGILPGITREVVIELARAMGVRVSEGEVKLADLGRFGEAFLTNSVMEIMPLVEVNHGTEKIIIGDGRPGEITRRLLAAYKEMVARETG
ncbi:aminotransferase class IV [Chloroflexota bacterium]